MDNKAIVTARLAAVGISFSALPFTLRMDGSKEFSRSERAEKKKFRAP
jgi:hypothetical protein